MAITDKDVNYVAELSRLELSAEERQLFKGQLDRILAHVDALQEANVEGVEPFISAASEGNVFRADEITPGLPREEALANAPRQQDGAFRVPRVVE